MAVALEEGESLMKELAVDVDLSLNPVADLGGQLGAVADGEHLFRFAEVAQQSC